MTDERDQQRQCTCAITRRDPDGFWYFQHSPNCPVHTKAWMWRTLTCIGLVVLGVLAALVAIAWAVWR